MSNVYYIYAYLVKAKTTNMYKIIKDPWGQDHVFYLSRYQSKLSHKMYTFWEAV